MTKPNKLPNMPTMDDLRDALVTPDAVLRVQQPTTRQQYGGQVILTGRPSLYDNRETGPDADAHAYAGGLGHEGY